MNIVMIFFVSLFVFILNSAYSADFTIMTYNVENLFDAVHDEGQNDWEYLPKEHPLKRENCLKIEIPVINYFGILFQII